MPTPIDGKAISVSVGAGYYSGDSFPGLSFRRSDVRGHIKFDYAGYRKQGVKFDTSAGVEVTAGKNFQTMQLDYGCGGKIYEQGNKNLSWNTSLYLRGEHTTSSDAKYVDAFRFEKQRVWCDETLVHNYNNVYGGIGLNTGLTYTNQRLTLSANAALEYGEHNGIGSSIDCTNPPAAARSDMVRYAQNKALEESKRVAAQPDKIKGIFSANADYKVSKKVSVGAGLKFNTAKAKEAGVFARVAYNF